MFSLSGRVWRKFTSKAPGLPKKLQFKHPKVSTIVACSAHLLVIKVEKGEVTILDSRQKDHEDYANMTGMLEK